MRHGDPVNYPYRRSPHSIFNEVAHGVSSQAHPRATTHNPPKSRRGLFMIQISDGTIRID